MSANSHPRRTSLRVESLETREVPAQFGNPWADPTHPTLSFARDGASALGVDSALQARRGIRMSRGTFGHSATMSKPNTGSRSARAAASAPL